MGKKYLIGEQHNQLWQLGERIGNKFEDNIYDVITNELASFFEYGLRINQTKRANDGGKDIIITSPVNIPSLFGISFNTKGKDYITIHIECKSTNYPNLRYEKIIPSTVKNKKQKIDYFVLVTNSEILPYTYYMVEEELKDNPDGDLIEFKLVDQYILANSLKDKYNDLFGNIPLYKGNQEFYGEYQIVSVGDEIEYKYEIYFLFRNYGKKILNCCLSLVTDINWYVNENTSQFMLDPNNCFSKKLEVSSNYLNGLDTLRFRVEENNVEKFVLVNAANLNEYFTPQFIGKGHKKIQYAITDKIKNANSDKLFCLWGISGIGKTRIIQEIIKTVNGTNFDILKCSLKKDNQNTIEKIIKFLTDKGYSNEKTNESFSDFIINCKKNFRTALIVLDDFHYAKKMLVDEVKRIVKHNAPVILIISGRTDYSYGNNDYYHFIKWSNSRLAKDEYVHEIHPLKPEETKRLIKTMVNKIPNEALECLMKKSMNNPLFIIQYIEYLLGEKLVYLKNKNTVSICDVSFFNSKDSIPEQIATIYKKRLNHLESLENKDYIRFLYILCVYDGEISIDNAMKLYDQENEVIPYLLENRYIVKENATCQFIHESLFTYIQEIIKSNKKIRKRIAHELLSRYDLTDLNLPDFTIGRLYLWDGKKDKAKNMFLPILKEMQKYSNFSNIDIDMTIYDYLYDTFEAYKEDSNKIDTLKKLLNSRIYTTLHYLIPYIAVRECDDCLKLAKASDSLKSDNRFLYSILSQKAHALLNSGKNTDGMLVLNELQSRWIVAEDDLDNQTLFDAIDRLSAIYIKYNCYDIAKNYNDMEIEISKRFDDLSTSVIAYRTQSKLYYLNDYIKCKESLDKADEILSECQSLRLSVNNSIYRVIVDFSYKKFDDYESLINKIMSIKELALNNRFNRAIIQSEMVLAALYLKRNRKGDPKTSKYYIESAIDYSVKFGIPSYNWQLYNLLAIVASKLKENTNDIKQYFDTVYTILDQQGLLYLGNRQLCYSNILAISNIGFFWQTYDSETSFNERLSKILFFGDDNKKDVQTQSLKLKDLFDKAAKKSILFTDNTPPQFLIDDETRYYIALT